MIPTENFKNRRILVIDDNPSIHEDVRKILGPRTDSVTQMADASAALFDEEPVKPTEQILFEIDSAYQGEEGLKMVQDAVDGGNPYAVAFVDVRMPPGWDGVETVTRIWKYYPEIQVVICTAYSDYSWEEMIRQLGRSDRLVILKKPFDTIEVLQLAHTLTEKWMTNQQLQYQLTNLDHLVTQRTTELQAANEKLTAEIAGRMQTEKALRLSEERFSKAFKASPIPLAIQSLLTGKYVDANEGFQEITGFSHGEVMGKTPRDLNLWVDAHQENHILKMLRQDLNAHNLACQMRNKAGQVRDVLLCAELFELEGELNVLLLVQDITEQLKLESQLRQSQKMDAIGQLAAGVAHDFNNILTVIQGNGTLLLKTRDPDAIDYKPLSTICAAADRASKLVRQLLTFSRKQVRQAQPMILKDTMDSVSDMLPRLLGAQIKVSFTTNKDLPHINADSAMMEQLLMNLAVNARDAMENGGELVFNVEPILVTAGATKSNNEARPGQFVCLSVRDTGCGMPPEILTRIFEPFFTTKPTGKGTGLGLATVYGIVKQHDGWLEVQSEVGHGTTFKIFLPVCKELALPKNATKDQVPDGGNERILVVEDEEVVREFVVELLQAKGYKVYQAGSGAQALQQWTGHVTEIDLLLTDMVMPEGVMGRQLAEKLLAEDPELRVVYTSGYSPGMAGKDATLLEGRNFLPKPYLPAKLLEIVREALDLQSSARKLARQSAMQSAATN